MTGDALGLVLRMVSEEPTALGHPGPAAVDDRAAREAFRLAEANGLFYALANRWLAAGRALPRSTEAAWSGVPRQREELRRSLIHLNQAASSSGCDYTVIKEYRALENLPRDIDVFVREPDQPRFLQALTQAGFGFSYRDQAEVSLSKPGCLRVDVYGRIHYLHRDFLDPDFLIGSRRLRTTHDVEHPGLVPEAAYLLNAAHSLFGHAALTLLDFLDFRALRAQIGDQGRIRRMASDRGWGRVLDRWNEHLVRLEHAVYEDRDPVRFPVMNGRRFVLECIEELDGAALSRHDRRALSLSLLWDDLVFLTESSGIADALRRSGVASAASNTAGHRIRLMRGDRKGLGSVQTGREAP